MEVKQQTTLMGEIEYLRENREKVHSDIEPKDCNFWDIDPQYREYLHSLLDEWLDKSRGTGVFYIGNEEYILEQLTKELVTQRDLNRGDPE